MQILVTEEGKMEVRGGNSVSYREEFLKYGGAWHSHKESWVFPLASLKDVRRLLDEPQKPKAPPKKTGNQLIVELLERVSSLEDRVITLEKIIEEDNDIITR
jgi:hypothetical protein